MAIYGNGKWRVLYTRLERAVARLVAAGKLESTWAVTAAWREWTNRKAAEQGIPF